MRRPRSIDRLDYGAQVQLPEYLIIGCDCEVESRCAAFHTETMRIHSRYEGLLG